MLANSLERDMFAETNSLLERATSPSVSSKIATRPASPEALSYIPDVRAVARPKGARQCRQ